MKKKSIYAIQFYCKLPTTLNGKIEMHRKCADFVVDLGNSFFFFGKTSRQTFLPVLPAYLEHCFAFQLKFRIKFVSQ